jgi:hypothetical protein
VGDKACKRSLQFQNPEYSHKKAQKAHKEDFSRSGAKAQRKTQGSLNRFRCAFAPLREKK